MSSVKRSSTRRKRCGGSADRGERFMREAIGLIFSIYGKKYINTHPGTKFITPTVDEFFAHIDDVGMQIKAEIASNRPKKSNRKFRPLGSPSKLREINFGFSAAGGKKGGAGWLETLLNYIIGPAETTCQKVFRIISISLYGVMISVLLTKLPEYMMVEGATLYSAFMSAKADPTYINSFADPLRWLSARLFPAGLTYYDTLFVGLADFIGGGFGAIKPETLAPLAGKAFSVLGLGASFVCEKLVNSTLYHRTIVMPLSAALYAAGMESCNEVYRTAGRVGVPGIVGLTSEKLMEFITAVTGPAPHAD